MESSLLFLEGDGRWEQSAGAVVGLASSAVLAFVPRCAVRAPRSVEPLSEETSYN